MEEERRADRGDDDARLAHGGDRSRLGAGERGEHEAVGDPHPETGDDEATQLGAERLAALEPRDPERVADRWDDQRQLEVA